MIRPKHWYQCRVCGGPAHRRVNATLRHGQEDTDAPLLHLDEADWVDDPHNVVPIDRGPIVDHVKPVSEGR